MTLTFAGAMGMAAAALGLSLAASSAWGAAPDKQLIEQGAYLARAGDCIACHSAVGGKPFAGGLALATPIGKVYSTNITPDPKSGIGQWSFIDFDKLMRTGVTKAGYTVYPAMPYPSYSRLSVTDMQALYAYFMHGVKPESTPNKAVDISWPLSMRFPLTFWRWAFAPTPQPYVPSTGGETPMMRGAYLVEGLGHCGACHTARAFTMQETALTGIGHNDYLAGGAAIEGWSAPSLRNEHGGGLARWSEVDIVDFLRSGRNGHSASFGPMNDVVTDSTQYLTEADLASVATYLKSLPASNDAPAFVPDPKVGQALFIGKPDVTGALLYLNKCAGCHRSDGAGGGKAFPALTGNALLQSADASSTVNIILSGGAVPSTHTAPSSLTMAPYADQLNDEQVAQVVNFIRTSWGNHGATVTTAQVAKIRKIAVQVKVPGAAAFAAGRPNTMPSKLGASQ